MPDARPRDVIAFTPGPVHVRPEVLAAMATPPLPHRSEAFRAVVRRVGAALPRAVGSPWPVVPVLASATGGFEASLAALARRRVLCLANGSFGERWARVAAELGFEVESLGFPHGDVVDPDAVERALSAGSFDAVTFVHSETSTGALSDAAAVGAAVARRAGTALLVDAVSSLGAVELPWAAFPAETVVVGSTGKGLACPPGMAVVAVSPGGEARARESRAAVSTLRLAALLDWHRRGETPQTPATSLWHALDVQMARMTAEGIAARAARHREMSATAVAWAAERFAVLGGTAGRTPGVTVVENTRGIGVPALLDAVEARGFRIADGHGALAGATFRIGHLGDVTPAELAACLAALDAAGTPVDPSRPARK
ncbi:MAG: Soluble hydrogenase 42 kDa subunit [Planctomycetes bacterium]|nr:Soluble hydrogenase 42 kDa subunit [Planctomycetota bacterium]